MKILIICSKTGSKFLQTENSIKTDGLIANERIIPLLKELGYMDNVVQILELPNTYPILIDDPLEYLPDKLEKHDIAIAIGIHEDILMELPRLISLSEGKALLVPLESKDWLSKWVRDKTIEECKKYKLEYAFPKPFCALEYGEFKVINRFIEKFKIGKPKYRLYVDKNNKITKAEILITTPCGNLYNIAKKLEGSIIDTESKDIAARYWHGFSCLGDVYRDAELGDTVVHVAGHIHYNAIDEAEIVEE
ncbi:DUF166 family protein [Clostridium sp. A1-XYC3]|uniref:DUF166 family protein n=1 Tax=Clostridium tanneri TaxID=3037988 RepID=A0ABU4JU56_9CLOT|nr:DUF166 family protein [Clostridium sp. A1-XYC3]MDW8801479.1 DUF166 family protein [Clostridium sp. A1-XYC3]